MYPTRPLIPFGYYSPDFVFGGENMHPQLGPPSLGHLHHHYPLHLLPHHKVGMSEIASKKDSIEVHQAILV